MADYQAQCSSNRYITLLLRTQVVSQDVAGNTSTINWSLHVLKSSASTSATWGNCSYSVTINGNAYSGSGQVRVEAGGDTTVLSGTTVIPHNADGTKSFNLRASISGYIVGSLSDSESLATIPRASTIACGTFTMGSSGAITITRASSGFTHTILWAFGTASGTVVTKTAGTSVPWTPPTATMAPQIPNATAGTGTLTCITYSGNTEIGRTYSGFTAYLPASVVPSISGVTTTEGTAGLADKFGAFVQYKSTLKVSVSAAGIYGSTIKSCTVNVDSKTYSGTSIITSAITGSGALTMTVTVIDSRGRTTSKAIQVTVVPYAAPAITAFYANRCDVDGTADDSGDYVSITYAYTIAPVGNNNTASAKIQYKRSTLSEWNDVLMNSAYTASTTAFPEQMLLSDYQWDLRITVSDYFGSTTMTLRVPSADVIMDLLASGDGMGIGKTAEIPKTLDLEWALLIRRLLTVGTVETEEAQVNVENGYISGRLVASSGKNVGVYDTTHTKWIIRNDIDGNTYIAGGTSPITDYVVAQGVSGIWTYRKYNSGIAECWGITPQKTVELTNPWGGAYASAQSIPICDAQPYPFGFATEPVVCATPVFMGYNWWLTTQIPAGTNTYSPGFQALRGAPGTVTGKVFLHAIGRWK